MCSWLLLISMLNLVKSITLSDLYPYGVVYDTALPPNDDQFVGPIAFDGGKTFNFFNHVENQLFIDNNGVISFDSGVSEYVPIAFPISGNRLLTAFWADIDTRGTGHVWYRQIFFNQNDPSIIKCKSDVLHDFNSIFTDDVIMWIVTWDAVGYYSFHTSPTNTFQAIICADSTSTYVYYLYPENGINWMISDVQPIPAQIGFNEGDGINYYITPQSRTNDVINVDSIIGNVGRIGVWAFRVSNEHIEPPPLTPAPTTNPTNSPSFEPTFNPTKSPTNIPTHYPTSICQGNIDTAIAYDNNINSICFSKLVDPSTNKIISNKWGWTNGPYNTNNHYPLNLTLYSGAGDCDINKGRQVGYILIFRDSNCYINVIYVSLPKYNFQEIHLYVGSDVIFIDKGKYSVNWGRYPYNNNTYNAEIVSYMIGPICSNFYVTAQAEVCYVSYH